MSKVEKKTQKVKACFFNVSGNHINGIGFNPWEFLSYSEKGKVIAKALLEKFDYFISKNAENSVFLALFQHFSK